ncbi:heme oxygenase [Rhizobium sp. Root1203]|uniref:biliverdin-producing heme oxygenase n=1 Tax=Rhizobium sp. Root1203 TaxID=1736427 RepID=UPI00070E0E35|nr:biliverdin-producing heme oxygenase [Rhizobium sp. Root1203]KQV10771.1 heme oxygenase [Rhizobium sp. Root1203]
MPLRSALRAHTSDCHAAVDDIFGRFDLADPIAYRAFLSAHARIIPAMEIRLEEAGIGSLLQDWPARRRRHLLFADLADLGARTPPPLPAPPFEGRAALWGAAYVLEGSKLGGAMLAKRVPASLPSRYLTPPGPKGGARSFMEALDSADTEEPRAIEAARIVFGLFRNAAELQLELAVS